MSARTKVFVYGTLLRGEPNHRLLFEARFLRGAMTKPRFKLVSFGAFPALVEGGKTAVVGELFEVDEKILEALDRLEGHPDFYQRRRIRLEDGEEALAYLMASDKVRGRPRIVSGDWRAWTRKEEFQCEFEM